MNSTEHFARLWNGSEPGWVVVRRTEDREKFQVVSGAVTIISGDPSALKFNTLPGTTLREL